MNKEKKWTQRIICFVVFLVFLPINAEAYWQKVVKDGFGDKDNIGITAMVVFEEVLYVGVLDSPDYSEKSNPKLSQILPPLHQAELWRTSDGIEWSKINNALHEDDTRVCAMEVFKGELYVVVMGEFIQQMIRTTDGQNWQNFEANLGHESKVVMKKYGYDYLYVSNFHNVWRTNSDNWEKIKNEGARSIAIYNGYIYFINAHKLWRTPDGTDWETIKEYHQYEEIRFESMAVLGDSLYVTTYNDLTGSLIYAVDDENLTLRRPLTSISEPGLGNYITDMIPYEGHFYLMTYSFKGVAVWKAIDNNCWNWKKISFYDLGDPNNQNIVSASVFKHALYLGTLNYQGCQIWRYTHDLCPVELIFGLDSEEVRTLRSFRDQILQKTPAGRQLIKAYYQYSPWLIKQLKGNKEIKLELEKLITEITASLKNND